MPVKWSASAGTDYDVASKVRAFIMAIYGFDKSSKLFFTSGSCVGLRMLISSTDIHSIILTDKEYFTPQHFPGSMARTVSLHRLIQGKVPFAPDLIIISLISWQGECVASNDILVSLKSRYPNTKICLDCSHAGAIGFPSLGKLPFVDFIIGDCARWIAPSSVCSMLGFIYVREARFAQKVSRVLQALYLASETPALYCASRWVDPVDLYRLWEYIRRHRLSRNRLNKLHSHRMLISTEIAKQLGLVLPCSNILWIPDNVSSKKLDQLEGQGIYILHIPLYSGYRLISSAFVHEAE